MKKDSGFTLIELIAVIVIIGIIGGISALSTNAAGSAAAKGCAGRINSYIAKCRTGCFSRAGDVFIRIYEQDGKIIGEYYEGGNLSDTAVLSTGRAKVSYKIGGEVKDLGKAPGLKLSFYRSTGGLKPQTEGGTDFCTEIYVSGGRKSYVIKIVPSTGNHSII